jgi:hypothetical protein
MSDAAGRLAALDQLHAAELCARTRAVLDALAAVMNEETTLLRAGRFRDTDPLAAKKTALAQDYVGLARAVQRQAGRLAAEAPGPFAALKAGHERLATQMADNLKVVATLKRVTDDLLTDVATAVGSKARAATYGRSGAIGAAPPAAPASGIAINRAL